MAVKLKKRVVSIVIKNESIRIMELTKYKKITKIHKMFEIETPKGTVNDGMIDSPKDLAIAIGNALNVQRITTKDVVFSIVSGRIATKEVTVPDMKESKILDMVNSNASEFFPVDIDQYVIKYAVLEKMTVDDVKKIRLLVAAVPSALVETYYTLAKLLDMKIADMDYSGNSSSEVLKKQITQEFSVIIYVDREETVVSIYEQNVLRMQRNVPYGESVLVQTVMEQYELEHEEAALKKMMEEDFFSESNITEDMKDAMEYLVGSINRIADYYVSRHGGRPFEKAYIIGRIAGIEGFVRAVSREISMDISVINTLSDVEISFKHTGENAKKALTSYIYNIGAVINPIGITPRNVTEKENDKETMRVLAGVLAGSIIITAVITIVPMLEMMDTKKKLDNVKSKVEAMGEIESVVNEYYDARDMVSDAKGFANLTAGYDDYLHIFINELEKAMPSDVSFKGMNVSQGAVTVSGQAQSKSSVALLILNLQKIPTVSNVYVGNISEVKDGADIVTVSFSLSCTFMEVTETTQDID